MPNHRPTIMQKCIEIYNYGPSNFHLIYRRQNLSSFTSAIVLVKRTREFE